MVSVLSQNDREAIAQLDRILTESFRVPVASLKRTVNFFDTLRLEVAGSRLVSARVQTLLNPLAGIYSSGGIFT